MEKKDNIKKTWGNVFVSSFGYILVALFTALAGYTLSGTVYSDRNEFYNGLILIGALIILLAPYYISRQGLLERHIDDEDNKYDDWAVTVGFQVPLTVFFLCVFIIFFVLWQFYTPPSHYLFGSWADVITSLVIVISIFLILSYKSIRDVKRADTDKAFCLFERLLIPALATGILPFSFGWSISGSFINLKALLFSAVFVLILAIASNFKETVKFAILFGAFFMVFLVFSIFHEEELSTIVYGSFITLAMGVSEITKRVYLSIKKNRYYPKKESPDYYLYGANWSSVVFPILILLVPLFVSALPTWPIFIFITLQSYYWTFASDKFKKSKYSYFLGLMFGYGLPITIILIQSFKLPVTLITRSGANPLEIIGLPSFLLAIGIFIFIVFKLVDELKDFLIEAHKAETYKKSINTFFLLFISLIALIILILVIGSFSSDSLIRLKAYELILFSSIMLFIAGLVFFIKRVKDRPLAAGNLSEEKENNQQLKDNNHSTIKMLWVTVRPLPSVVAGLATFVLLFSNNQQPFWIDIIQATPLILVTMIGFLLNDIYDRDKDTNASVDRPIAKSLLNIKVAFVCSLFLSISAIGIALITNNLKAVNVILFTLTGVAIYSPLSKRFPLIKCLVTALLTISPILFAQFTAQLEVPIFVYVSVFVFIIGREILLDSKDFLGDIKSKIKTVVYYLHIHPSRYLAWILMFLGVAYFTYNLSNTYAVTLSLLGLVTLVIAFVRDIDNRINNGGITIMAMVFCILAIPFIF